VCALYVCVSYLGALGYGEEPSALNKRQAHYNSNYTQILVDP